MHYIRFVHPGLKFRITTNLWGCMQWQNEIIKKVTEVWAIPFISISITIRTRHNRMNNRQCWLKQITASVASGPKYFARSEKVWNWFWVLQEAVCVLSDLKLQVVKRSIKVLNGTRLSHHYIIMKYVQSSCPRIMHIIHLVGFSRRFHECYSLWIKC